MYILKNAKIVLENKIIECGWLEINNSKITSINEGVTTKEGMNLNGNILMPGFIDVHMHGGYGIEFETATIDGYNHVAENIVKEGVVRFCQGPVTATIDDLVKYFKVYANYLDNHNVGKKARHIGAHMEGPFINEKFNGAHNINLLHKPNVDEMKKIINAANGHIAYVTYAPELQNGEFTKLLIENNINPSIGHSNATFKEVEKELQNGAKHMTHLHNAMSPYHHRNPGMVNAGLFFDEIMTELITDGIHNDIDVIREVYKIKTADHMMIITDSMKAKGEPDGDYYLGPLPVTKKGLKITLADGTLAASGDTYNYNVSCFAKATKAPLTDIAKVSSLNAAKELRIFDKTGSIEVNKYADLVVLNNEFEVLMTIVEGDICFNTFN
ncbi:N-acetylglucosamine-6-phosphate deacetylase [Spiroplasma endosymbiont of Labia minor]|uniref:N-acetylglucosamine-6-phosphate deacetylase n=1 Tax=Spiroplasma endosymbiont of Labia minor TaxID=3066305 RepID=UPI0030CEDB46